ncbi:MULTISPECIES: ATP synthase F1 subunit delta [Gemella]|uniref:ATP synthase F1 subunit delta n=1 Tax=Gemella TaxID=1378 RepID=UPI0007680036|nr:MULTISPECIES: ATP synthase F1 subunit delta [Gemella]AME09991.1 ATP synthase F1 subunit delta [Gemella sp. oral taxon 928]AXI26130.1 ATP synthase F1 subunit delta [Gemella sp. ND 6198]
MSKSVLANKIGDSLFDVARDSSSLEEVLNDLKEVALAITSNDDFITLMNNPNIEKKQKIELIDAAFTNVNRNVVNVVKILAGNLQISLINFVLEEFEERFNRYSKNILVKVESASQLTQEQISELKEKLKAKLQLDNVEVSNVIDKSLIGGLKITYNNKVIDASIKARLNSIKKQISNI